MAEIQTFLNALNHPSRAYTPIPFWFLNGDLTHREIRRQLTDFCSHGVYGVVLHPRIGLSRRIEYLSPVFFRYLRTAVETAAELGMKIVLYDEGMYPSGSAGGQVVRDHPEWASRGIAWTEQLRSGDRVLCKTASGMLVERFSGGTIRGIHYGEDDGEPDAPASADILNPEAVERFVELTHEAYWREFREFFGSTIIGFFTDEPSILGRNVSDLQPWTKGFGELFHAAGGRLEGLRALFAGEENDDTALYHRMILEREGNVYYARLSRWCEEHGIALMGHPHRSDDIEVEKYFHIPGQDLVFRWVAPEKGGTSGMDSVMGHCSADMARWMGRNRNSNECFGACNREDNPWYFTGADMKWIIDWLAVRGVNLYIPHAFYYSLKGKRTMERPPDVGPGNIWWPHYRKWADYMARLSCLRTETNAIPRTALLCRNRDLHPEAAGKLLEKQIEFIYLPESMWGECEEKDGKLICRGTELESVWAEAEMFPSVSHNPFSMDPECECFPPQPDLRVVPLDWKGIRCWFCVNEGNQALTAEMILRTDLPLGQYDLWSGEIRRTDSEKLNGKRRFLLRMEKNESLVLFTCNDDAAWKKLPAKTLPAKILKAEDFTLQSEEPETCRKCYTAELGKTDGDVVIEIDAPEMTELYVDDRLADVAFWPPQRMTIPARMLKNRRVSVRLVVYGSKANQYGCRPVPYGLGI